MSSAKSARFRVLHTDCVLFPPQEEYEVLGEVGAEIIPRDCRSEDEVIEAARDVDAILNVYAKISRRVIETLDRCKVIVRYGVGVDTIDIGAATEHGIVVANVPDFCIEEVSNHAIMLLLACAKKLIALDRYTKAGHWGRDLLKPMGRVAGQTLGLVAFGKIARAVARKAKAFGLRVLAYDPYLPPEAIRACGVEPVELDTLLTESDFVSVHTPLTEKTLHMFGEREFRLMKPTAFFLNTGRGPVVDEAALVRALKEGWIAGAGLDVFEKEPPDKDNPLLCMDNVVVTPHTASYSDAAFEELRRKAALEVARVLTGKEPRAFVNPNVKPRVSLL